MLNARTNIPTESIQMSNPQSCHYLSMKINLSIRFSAVRFSQYIESKAVYFRPMDGK